MLFQPIYEMQPCPLPGYGDLSVLVLVNPTNAVWADFLNGGLEASADAPPETQAANREERRKRLGGAMAALYGNRAHGPLDFSTPDAALATMEHPDLPDEVALWLFDLPVSVRNRRVADLQKKLHSPSTPAT